MTSILTIALLMGLTDEDIVSLKICGVAFLTTSSPLDDKDEAVLRRCGFFIRKCGSKQALMKWSPKHPPDFKTLAEHLDATRPLAYGDLQTTRTYWRIDGLQRETLSKGKLESAFERKRIVVLSTISRVDTIVHANTLGFGVEQDKTPGLVVTIIVPKDWTVEVLKERIYLLNKPEIIRMILTP